jgi:CheY-like chemotaxis protein
LVVDDNVDLARGLARLLQIHGHDVRVAHDGHTGLDEARSSKPDVVLLDIGLPGMDGYQVAAHLRRDETIKDATLIAISGYGQDEDRRLAREAGFDHHLVKPIVADELLKIVEESER